MSKSALIDTGILIGLYNRGRFKDDYLRLLESRRIFFSSVTINEFIRGAHDAASKNLVNDFLEIVGNDLVTPTAEQWLECGRISETILKRKKRPKEAVVLLQNDILIALSARDMKAVLVTADKKDFAFIETVLPVAVEYW